MAICMDKRKRSVNWDEKEKRLLVDLVKENIAIVENVRPDTDSNLKKKLTWQMIENKFLLNGFIRDRTRIKEQWRRLKATARRNIQYYKKQLEICGIENKSIQAPTTIDYEIYDLIPHDFLEDGGNDSDTNSLFHSNNKKPKTTQESVSDESSDSSWPLNDSTTITQMNNPNSLIRLVNESEEILNRSRVAIGNIISNNTSHSNLLNDRIKKETNETEPKLNEQLTNSPDDNIQLDTIEDDEEEYANGRNNGDTPDMNLKLPPLHRIVQEPNILTNNRLPIQNHNSYNQNNNLDIDTSNMKLINTNYNITNNINQAQIELYNLKKRLLQVNIERLQIQKQFDIELHEYRMKIEREVAEKRIQYEDELNKLRLAMEKRIYEKHLECII